MQKLSQTFEKYLFWWVMLLFAFIPLYPKFPLIGVKGTYVAVRVEDFLIMAVVGWWMISILPRIKNRFSTTLTKTVLLFWAIGLLSLISGIFLTKTVAPGLGTLHYLRRIEEMILLFVAIDAFRNLKQVRQWLLLMLAVSFIVVIYGFGQQYLRFPVISTTNREFSKGLILFLSPEARVNSTFAGHYDLAIFLSLVLTIATAMLIYFKSFFKRIVISVVSFLGFIMLAMTAARVSFVGAVVGISSVFFLVGQKKLILVMVGLSLMAFVVSPDLRHRTVATVTVNFLGGGGPKYVPPVQKENPTKAFSIENAATDSATLSGVPVDVAPGEPLDTTELGVYRSYGIRLDVEWPRAVRAFVKNPLLGTGYSSISIATDNDYLRSLGETGILGTLSLGLVFFVIIKKMFRFFKRSSKSLTWYLNVGIACSLIGVGLTAFFIDVLESSKVAELLWLTLGALLAFIDLEEKQA
jgi:hypothetical protein